MGRGPWIVCGGWSTSLAIHVRFWPVPPLKLAGAQYGPGNDPG